MIDLYEKRTLAGIIEEIPEKVTVFKNIFFADEEVYPTSKIMFDVVKGGQQVAPFVSPRIDGTVLERRGYKTTEYEPPQIAPKRILTAEDLKKRLPGENMFENSGVAERAVKQVTKDFIELDDSIALREEQMCIELMTTGEISIKGEGVDDVVKIGEVEKVVITKLWNTAQSDPTKDLMGLRTKVSKSGFSPNIVFMSSEIANAFFQHEKVQKMFDIRNFDNGIIAPEILEKGVIYWGYIPLMGCHFYSYDGEYSDYDNINPAYPNVKPSDANFIPVIKKAIPENTLIMTQKGIGKMLYASISDLKLGDEATNKKRVTKTWETDSPSAKNLQVLSRPLPIIHNMDSVGIMEVL